MHRLCHTFVVFCPRVFNSRADSLAKKGSWFGGYSCNVEDGGLGTTPTACNNKDSPVIGESLLLQPPVSEVVWAEYIKSAISETISEERVRAL
ncbi:hypothetical protein QYF36_025698 [Acer negundo]|nr:hypothetical protein QYF36_025698 [Acer negundo]